MAVLTLDAAVWLAAFGAGLAESPPSSSELPESFPLEIGTARFA